MNTNNLSSIDKDVLEKIFRLYKDKGPLSFNQMRDVTGYSRKDSETMIQHFIDLGLLYMHKDTKNSRTPRWGVSAAGLEVIPESTQSEPDTVKTNQTLHKPSSTHQEIPSSMSQNTNTDDLYKSLRNVLDMAYGQATQGKGAERHGNGLAFTEQPMQVISNLLNSSDGMAHQAIKKIIEHKRLPTKEARIRELLGAINYIAGIVIREQNKE